MAEDDLSHLDARVASARPDEDPLRRAVRLSRVAAKLFGPQPAVCVGRYELLEELGRGGGGSVYAARDTELHREVAVKLLHCPSPGQRARALAEARTLAKLSHPNVVPMHDVGETGDYVFLVMERLSGPSLRAFAEGTASARDLAAAYLQAARGLAAAHAAGLVHRDFKPDNALFGADGRVRVVDFGLATDQADGALAGTPGYMAPEQREGGPAIDQFALGRSLEEALAGKEAPRHLRRFVARATATSPGARFPTMEALVAALAEDPRRRTRRLALVLAPPVLAVIAFFVGARLDAHACEGGPEALQDAWSPQRLHAAVAAIDAVQTPLARALAPTVRARLQALGEAWLAAHHDTCEQHRRAELSDAAFERARACLHSAHLSLKDAVELTSHVDAQRLDAAQAVVMALRSPARCSDVSALEATGPLDEPGQQVADALEIAASHARAATPDAVTLAEEALRSARALERPALEARALLTLGRAEMNVDMRRAAPPLEKAMTLGLQLGADALAVEAWARWSFAVTRAQLEAPDEVLHARAIIDAYSLRPAIDSAFPRALLLNNLGAIETTAGRFEQARADYSLAQSLTRRLDGPEAAELVAATVNLALLSADRSERTRLFETALSKLRTLVGPDHAQTLQHEMTALFDGDSPQRVVTALAEFCPRLTRLRPGLHQLVERCAFEWGWQAAALGDAEGVAAAAALLGHLRLDEPSAPARALAVIAAATAGRDVGAALRDLEAEANRPRGTAWYEHLYAADARLTWALALCATGRADAARSAATAAGDDLAASLRDPGLPYGVLLRRVPWARTLSAGCPAHFGARKPSAGSADSKEP